jgi:hypothetical protein
MLGRRRLDLLPANMNESATRLQHVENSGRYQLAVHPVEGLGERRISKDTQAGRKLLCQQPEPLCVGQVLHSGRTDRLVDHAPISVNTYDLGEQISQP